MTEIVPAILTNDISDFRHKVSQLLGMGHYFSKLHVDFIDGEYLPGKTILPADLEFFDSPFVLMAHFMTYNPQQYFDTIKKIGFSWAIVQFEAFKKIEDCLKAIAEGNSKGLKMGIAINPETPLHACAKIIPEVELVQIMGVHPGAQGRQFEPNTLEKVRELKALTRHAIISVDGGIRLELVEQIAQAGANFLVVGSALAQARHPQQVLEMFIKELERI